MEGEIKLILDDDGDCILNHDDAEIKKSVRKLRGKFIIIIRRVSPVCSAIIHPDRCMTIKNPVLRGEYIALFQDCCSKLQRAEKLCLDPDWFDEANEMQTAS